MKYKSIRSLLAAISFASIAFGQAGPEWAYRPVAALQARSAPEYLKSTVVYEVLPCSFTPEGTLKAVTARLPYLADLGIGIVYIIPFLKGSSSYTVSDYYAINPQYGTDADLQELVQSAHKLGMKVMLDVVFYHAAPDNVLMKDPTFFKRTADGKIILGRWKTPRPDFQNPKVREYFSENLVYWVKTFGVDGFRCDVSGGVPITFWEQAREALDKVNKDVILLAECDMPEEQVKAFDISYNYPFYYFRLAAVVRDGEPATRIREGWEKARTTFPRGARFLHFSDNHDQPRAVRAFGEKGALATAVLNFTLDGIPFIYNGQEIGDTARTAACGEPGTLIAFPSAPAPAGGGRRQVRTFETYKRLIQLRKDPVFNLGELIWVNNSDPNDVITFLRKKGDDQVVVVINMSNRMVEGTIDLPWADYSPLENLIDKEQRIRIPIQESKLTYKLGAFEFIVGRVVPPLTMPAPKSN